MRILCGIYWTPLSKPHKGMRVHISIPHHLCDIAHGDYVFIPFLCGIGIFTLYTCTFPTNSFNAISQQFSL